MHDEKMDFKMMLVMMFCCAALPLLITYLGSKGLTSGNSAINIAVLIILFFAAHYLIMKIFCGRHVHKEEAAKADGRNQKEKSCH